MYTHNLCLCLSVFVHTYIYTPISLLLCLYIYVDRHIYKCSQSKIICIYRRQSERDKEGEKHIYIYMYVHIHIHIHIYIYNVIYMVSYHVICKYTYIYICIMCMLHMYITWLSIGQWVALQFAFRRKNHASPRSSQAGLAPAHVLALLKERGKNAGTHSGKGFLI